MDDSTEYRKLKDLGGKQPESGCAYIVEPDEFAHYKVTIPDNYWKVVDEARNQYHDSSNTDSDSGKFAGRTIAVDGSWGANLPPWAVSTHVEPQYVGSTAIHDIYRGAAHLSPIWALYPTPPTPLTFWEKICLFFKLFFTGRS